MRLASSKDRRRDWIGAAASVVVMLGLAGCSSPGAPSSSSLTSFTSMFRSTPQQQAAAGPTFDDADCPVVQVRFGASTLAIAAKDQEPTAADLRYQASFNRLARQCTLIGTTLNVKVGVEGRVVVGPAGAPSQVDIPLRYAVVQEGISPKTITTKFKRFAVAMPPGETNVTFTDIEQELNFPLPSLAQLQAYVIYVGFDEIGDRPPPKAPRKPAKKSARPS